jgi:hypothetical protein
MGGYWCNRLVSLGEGRTLVRLYAELHARINV